MSILIISRYFGKIDRGAETWAKDMKERFGGVDVVPNVFVLPRLVKSDVIIPTNGRFQVLACRIIAWILGKPMVVFGHSGPGADDKWNLLCSPDVFVAFSEEQTKWAGRFKLPWTRVVKIPHAVDLERFKPAKKKPREKIVLCVAANMPSKRVGLVKTAVGRLRGFRFVAVGKGNQIETVFEEMPEVYRRADVFCFVPFPQEAFGLVFLEALSCNLPVVATDDPVRREIVGDAGVFVKNPEDASELAGAIKKAYETDWDRKPRKQAEKFGWDKIRKKYEELFEGLRK